MVHAGRVFIAGIHLSSTWTSESFESVRWNACEHRLDLGLYSHPAEFMGNGVRNHVNSKGKIPSTRRSEKGRTCDAALRRTANPIHYRLSYSSPVCEQLNWKPPPCRPSGKESTSRAGNKAILPSCWHYWIRAWTGWPSFSFSSRWNRSAQKGAIHPVSPRLPSKQCQCLSGWTQIVPDLRVWNIGRFLSQQCQYTVIGWDNNFDR